MIWLLVPAGVLLLFFLPGVKQLIRSGLFKTFKHTADHVLEHHEGKVVWTLAALSWGLFLVILTVPVVAVVQAGGPLAAGVAVGVVSLGLFLALVIYLWAKFGFWPKTH